MNPQGAKSYGGESGYGLVGANIDHMRLDFPDRTTSPVTIKSLGGYRYYAFIVPKGKEPTGAGHKWPSPATTR